VLLKGQGPALQALAASTFVADCTLEGLMHAAELPAILKDGARVLYASDEHPEVLERLAPSPADEQQVRAAMRRLREAKLDEAAVLALFADRLARFKHPRRIVFVEQLPKNALGQVQQSELRKLL